MAGIMRNIVPWMVVVAGMAPGAMLLGARSADQLAPPSANNAVSLTAAAADQATPAEATAEPGGMSAAETGMPAAPSGARPLGSPSGMFSLGDRPDERGAEATGWIGRFDPRTNQFTRVLAALGLVLGLIVVLRLVLQRAASGLGGGARPSGILEVLARYPFARGQQLVLMRLGRRIILAHQASGGLTTISEVSDAEEVAALMARIEAGSRARPARGRSFGRLLRASASEYEPAPANGRHFVGGLGNAGDGDIIDLTRLPRPRRPTKRPLT